MDGKLQQRGKCSRLFTVLSIIPSQMETLCRKVPSVTYQRHQPCSLWILQRRWCLWTGRNCSPAHKGYLSHGYPAPHIVGIREISELKPQEKFPWVGWEKSDPQSFMGVLYVSKTRKFSVLCSMIGLFLLQWYEYLLWCYPTGPYSSDSA